MSDLVAVCHSYIYVMLIVIDGYLCLRSFVCAYTVLVPNTIIR